MAQTRTLEDGRVIILCPVCGQWRDAQSFRGNVVDAHGWFTSCHYCRTSEEVTKLIGKPRDADWDDKANSCVKCGGTGTYRWGSIVNGKATKSGVCFQCKGKGHTTWRDEARNSTYFSNAMAGMVSSDLHNAGYDTPRDKMSREDAEKVVRGLNAAGPSPEEKELASEVAAREYEEAWEELEAQIE